MTKKDPELEAAYEAAANEVYKDVKGVRKHDPVKNPFGKPAPKKTSVPVSSVKLNDKVPLPRGLPPGMSPVTAYVRSLDGDYKTTQEVADELGCSAQLIRKLARQRVTQAPSYVAPFGQIKVHLYTSEDVQALREYLGQRRIVRRRDEL